MMNQIYAYYDNIFGTFIYYFMRRCIIRLRFHIRGMRHERCGMRYPACDVCDSKCTCVPIRFQSVIVKIWQYNRNTDAEVLNYNLMWRNSNNTSGWPDNLKSGQIVRETPAPDVTFWIPLSGLYLLPYESLHGAIQFAVSPSVRSRRTNRMPHPDIWNRTRLFRCCSIFAVSACRIPHAAYMESQLNIIYNFGDSLFCLGCLNMCTCLLRVIAWSVAWCFLRCDWSSVNCLWISWYA